jgi:WhiB family transcriptional regulator, redox-sensing transcriptional regulator
MLHPEEKAMRAWGVSPALPKRDDLPCLRHDPELWFAQHPAQIEQAKALCGECPVREACLIGALARGEAAGVWGGQLLENGVILAKKRGRGRPRKNAA